jgi:hypothetical protein
MMPRVVWHDTRGREYPVNMISKVKMDELLKLDFIGAFPAYYDEGLRVWPLTDSQGELWKVEELQDP